MEDFAAAARHAHDLGYTPGLFSLEPQRDAPVSEKLAGLLPFDCIRVPGCGDADAILALIGRMRAVVSMRLHALIFAFGQGVPLAGVVYDPKVSGFLDYLGQKNYVNLDELSAEALNGLLDAALGGAADPETRDHMRGLAEKNKFYAQKALEE